jgi:serine protease Do
MTWPIMPTGATPDLSNNDPGGRRRGWDRIWQKPVLSFFLSFFHWGFLVLGLSLVSGPAPCPGMSDDELSQAQWQQVRALEQQRVSVIQAVAGSVIAVYGESRQGGGAGVIIHPSGIALTNHHVIMGAGVSGWGGLADGNFYRWRLIGTDPGGDVSVIQMEGLASFPFASLGDSDRVQPGDWAIAMGNPFVLTEDQFPTVTLGIVSGVKRYQPGEGGTMLVYGNCIQIDSSINPGNSGGPLFNLEGKVIGINGRGSFSFKDRGKVNVGLGYAISANQIKNFLPDLLATKLIQHGTLDASFSDRQGKVICSTINRDSPVALAGLSLGDELLEFEGETILNANQFTNLICTLPVDWPAELKIRKADGQIASLHVRLLGLPYPKPPAEPPARRRPPNQPNPEPESEQEQQEAAMRQLLSAPPNQIRLQPVNQTYSRLLLDHWQRPHRQPDGLQTKGNPGSDRKCPSLEIEDSIFQIREDRETEIGRQRLQLSADGRFQIRWTLNDQTEEYRFGGQDFYIRRASGAWELLPAQEAVLRLPILQALAIAAIQQELPFSIFGNSLIDGGDKASGQPSFRLVTTGERKTRLFYWLSFENEREQAFHPRLLKIASDKDGTDGAVLFAQWNWVEEPSEVIAAEAIHWQIPAQRKFVSGLSETVQLVLRNQQARWSEPLEPFELPGNESLGQQD